MTTRRKPGSSIFAAWLTRWRGIANQLRFDLRRADQLRALADGFERMADRVQQEADAAG